jgi:hypothetical protein
VFAGGVEEPENPQDVENTADAMPAATTNVARARQAISRPTTLVG